MKTITTMVLISIDPFAGRRFLLLVVALLCFSAVCFADPVLMAQRYRTPISPSRSAEQTKSQTNVFGSSKSDAILERDGVDFPARSQEFLPSNDRVDALFSSAQDLFFSTSNPVREGCA
jgi:hypothetical protein